MDPGPWVKLAVQQGYKGARAATLIARTNYGGVYGTEQTVFKVVQTGFLSNAVSETAVLSTVEDDSRGVLGCSDVFCACESGVFTVVYVMPRQRGDLSSQLDATQPGDDTVMRQVCDLLVGVARLHRLGILHGDIKPANVLVDEDGGCKLADFGISTVLRKGAMQSSLLCSSWWRPPNAALAGGDPKFDSDKYSDPRYAMPVDEGDDVFAAALVIFEMVYGRSLVGTHMPVGGRLQTMGEVNIWLMSFYARHVHAAPRADDTKFWNAYDPRNRVPMRQRRDWSARLAHKFTSFVRSKFKTERVSRRVEVYLLELVDRCMSWKPWHRPSARELLSRIARDHTRPEKYDVSSRLCGAEDDRGAVRDWWRAFGSDAVLTNLADNARSLVKAYRERCGWLDDADPCADVVAGSVDLTLRATALAFSGLGGGTKEDRRAVVGSVVETMRACTMMAFARQRSYFNETDYHRVVYGDALARAALHGYTAMQAAVVRVLRGRLHASACLRRRERLDGMLRALVSF